MAIATIVSIGAKRGQVIINDFSRRGQGTTETRHIVYDRFYNDFVDRRGNVYRTLEGGVPTSGNRLVMICSPIEAYR